MTEEEIIMLIRTGGKALDAGVKALYQSTAQAMLRFFVYQGVSGQDAQDILQDTVVKIVPQRRQLRRHGYGQSLDLAANPSGPMC